MMIMIVNCYMISTLILLMILVLNLISKKSFLDREKSSPFECGFDPRSSARMPFSLQFFLIAVIFLIFDVELTMIMPMILSIRTSNMMNLTMLTSFFMIILIMGLYHEWNQGSLDWSN